MNYSWGVIYKLQKSGLLPLLITQHLRQREGSSKSGEIGGEAGEVGEAGEAGRPAVTRLLGAGLPLQLPTHPARLLPSLNLGFFN